MKALLCLAFILVLTTALSAQSRAEREVSGTVKRWADSIIKRDMTGLGEVLADEIVITDDTGKVRGKAEELDILKPMPHVQTLSVENQDLKIKVYGKTAVATALTKMKFNTGGMDTGINLRYTAVFIKRDGRWQIVALQTTRVGPPK